MFWWFKLSILTDNCCDAISTELNEAWPAWNTKKFSNVASTLLSEVFETQARTATGNERELSDGFENECKSRLVVRVNVSPGLITEDEESPEEFWSNKLKLLELGNKFGFEGGTCRKHFDWEEFTGVEKADLNCFDKTTPNRDKYLSITNIVNAISRTRRIQMI